MTTTVYNSWPLGRLPKHFQRQELYDIRDKGYHWDDPRDVVSLFENKMAEYAGCKYAAAVDCCSNAIFLCLKYLNNPGVVTIPNRTYVSVPMQIKHAGYEVNFENIEWQGLYQLKPYPIYDSAVRMTKGMFIGGEETLQALSFQIKKRLPIGKGGMILTNSKKAYDWIKLASYDGRDLNTTYDTPNHIKMMGYHMYMTPEDAARGILLMDQLPESNKDSGCHENYPDLTNLGINWS